MTNESFFTSMETITALHNASIYFTTAPPGDDHAPHELEKSVLAALLICGALGVIGNTVVIAVIFTSTSMHRKVTNMYIINQSFLDVAAAVVLLVTHIVLTGFKLKAGDFPGMAGQLFCRLFQNELFMWGLFFSSTINLVALAVERFFAILHPFTHKSHFTPTKVIISCVCIWIFGLLQNFVMYYPTTLKFGDNCWLGAIWPSELTRNLVAVYQFLIQFVVPLIIMGYCYGKIVMKLRTSVGVQVPGQKESAATIRARKNTLKTLIVVTACFFLCLVWNQVLFVFFGVNLVSIEALLSPFGIFTKVMVVANCCVNPIIYAANYREFQRGLKKLFCRGKMALEDNGSAAVQSQATQETQPSAT